MTIINGIDLDLYVQTHSHEVISGVRQFLEVFKCCEELKDALVIMRQNTINQHDHLAQRVPSTRILKGQAKKRKKPCGKKGTDLQKDEMQELRPVTVVGKCPRCGSDLLGTPVATCETEKSGRVFYKECSACKYYAEVFKKRNKHYEMEGD
jgi:hypothetical protein